MKPFIAIAGVIGIGKSTLTEQLSQKLNLPIYKEPVEENPYLGLFYGDMKRWAFPMQIFLLNARFAQHQELVWRREGGVQDRSIYEDTIFASMLYQDGLMSKLDYECYLSLFLNMTKFLQRPDTVLYLDGPPQIALQRIQTRGRNEEKTISLEYLQHLKDGYDSFYDDMKTTLNIVKIDWTEYKGVEEVCNYIQISTPRWGKHL